MRNTTEAPLTSGPVLQRLMGFVVPYLLTSLLQVLYGVVDTYTVGIFTDATSISAVSIGTKVSSLVTVVVMGLATGATVLIGRSVGERNHKAAAAATGNTISFFLLFAAVATPLMLVMTPRLVLWVQTPETAVPAASAYVFICACGLPFVIAYNLICSILRAIGDSKTPLFFVAIACSVNIGLDFLMVGYFHVGAAGAAIATIIAQAVSSVCGIVYLLLHKLPFPVTLRDLGFQSGVLGKILGVGLPVAVQDGCMHICFIVLTAIANLRGVTDSAGVGIVETIVNAVFLVAYAFEAAVVTMTAQNLGAGRPERVRSAVGYSIFVVAAFGAAVMLVCNRWGEAVVGIFTGDPAVIRAGSAYLRTYSIDTMLAAFSFILSGYLCGKGSSGIVFVQNMLAIGLVRLPVAYYMSALFPDTMLYMGLSSPCGTLFSSIFLGASLLIRRDMLLPGGKLETGGRHRKE